MLSREQLTEVRRQSLEASKTSFWRGSILYVLVQATHVNVEEAISS
jgi:hypothetical protein